MKYDYSQEVANEMLENSDNENDRLSSEVLEWQGKYGIAQAEVDSLRHQRDELKEVVECALRTVMVERHPFRSWHSEAKTILANIKVTP